MRFGGLLLGDATTSACFGVGGRDARLVGTLTSLDSDVNEFDKLGTLSSQSRFRRRPLGSSSLSRSSPFVGSSKSDQKLSPPPSAWTPPCVERDLFFGLTLRLWDRVDSKTRATDLTSSPFRVRVSASPLLLLHRRTSHSRSDWKKGICSSVNMDHAKRAKRYSALMPQIRWVGRLWYRLMSSGEPECSSTCVTSSADSDVLVR